MCFPLALHKQQGRLKLRAIVEGTHLQWERDVCGDLLAGGAGVFEALDVEQQHFGQAVNPKVLCGCRPLVAVLALKRLVTLSIPHCCQL